MGEAMLNKSLIQFSFDEWGCVHSLLFDLRANYGGVMKIRATSFKRSYACAAALSASDPAADHHSPSPPLKTPGHSQASLGQSFVRSLLLSPGAHKVLFVPSKSLFPQSYVCSGGSMVG